MNSHLLEPIAPSVASADSYGATPVDLQQLLKRCLGNATLAERVLSNFEQRFEADFERLKEAVQSNNSPLVAKIAHQLKGTSANLAAAGLQSIAAELEGLGRADRLDVAGGLLDQLRREWRRIQEFRSSMQRFQGVTNSFG